MTTTTLQDRFEAFHAANPKVYTALCMFAREYLRSGKRTIAIKTLYERVRWELSLQVHGSDTFKMNNNHHSRYARLIMQNEPDLSGAFNTRELRA